MRTLVSESAVPVSIASSPTPASVVTLSTPWIVPRLQGYGKSMRGRALDATFADRAEAFFTVRLNGTDGDVFANFLAELFIDEAPLLSINPDGTYPERGINVSSSWGVDGHLFVDLSTYGVCRARLRLTRLTAAAVLPSTGVSALMGYVRVFSDERVITAGPAAKDPRTPLNAMELPRVV